MKKNPPEMLEMKQNTGRDKTKENSVECVSNGTNEEEDRLSELGGKAEEGSHQTRTRTKSGISRDSNLWIIGIEEESHSKSRINIFKRIRRDSISVLKTELKTGGI